MAAIIASSLRVRNIANIQQYETGETGLQAEIASTNFYVQSLRPSATQSRPISPVAVATRDHQLGIAILVATLGPVIIVIGSAVAVGASKAIASLGKSMDRDADLEDVISRIEKAFGDMEIPSSDQIINVYDYGDSERLAVKNYFNGKSWKELVGKLPNRPEVASANSFMLPSAIRYYLPAYMLTVARFLETKKSEVGVAAEVLVSMLTNPRLKPLFDPLQAEEMRQSENYRAQVAAVRDLLTGNAEALERFDALHFPLHPPEHIIEQIQKKWDEFAGGLTDGQNRAIKSFLNFLMRHYPEDFEDDVTRIVMGNSKFQ